MALPTITTPTVATASGPAFRVAREAAGVSVRAIASRAEITHSTLSRWERGERDVSEATYQHLSNALADYIAGRWAA